MAKLEQLITHAQLRRLAGAAAFERGEDYLAGGSVDRLRQAGERLSVRVMGSEAYQVELWVDGDELGYDCTCPRAADGYFCKHCVAVGLALLDVGNGVSDAVEPEHKRDPTSSIREFLEAQPSQYLIDLLMDQVPRNDILSRSLLLQAERASGSVDIVKSFRKAIDSATRIGRFIDWPESGGFSADLDPLADALEELLESGAASALVELAEYAIERLDQALQQVDDSDGEVGGVLERLGALHVRACALAKPDPVALAERLFRYETSSSFDPYYNSVLTYRDTLGPDGIARFRELAEQQWDKIKDKGPDDRQGRDGSPNRFCITHIMENLARVSGDTEALVAVKSRDLSLPYHYLEIAEIYQQADQPDVALAWAERGLKAFPERTDHRLRDFLVTAYLKQERHDEALHLTWVQFEERPMLEHYRKLHVVATQLGQWPERRQRALALIEASALRDAGEITRWKPMPSLPDWSLRVEIALWEDDLDTAWHTVQHGTCHRNCLLSLAGKLENPRPVDAVTLYRRIIPGIIEDTNNRAYEEAIRYLNKVGALLQTLGGVADFVDYTQDLRREYKAKRNFIKLLDGVTCRVVER